MLGKVKKLVSRKGFVSKIWKAVCIFGAAVLGGLIVNKIKSPEEISEKKCTFSAVRDCISGIGFVKNHWRKLVAVFLVGWGFGIWASIKAFISNMKIEEAIV